MSNTRQAAAEPVLRGYAVTHPPGSAQVRIEPGWDQLLYTASGVLTLLSGPDSVGPDSIGQGPGGRVWTVPPHRAVWIPAGDPVIMTNRRPVAVRALFLPTGSYPAPPGATAFTLPRFGRELLLHVVGNCPFFDDRPVDAALRTVLLDQLTRWSTAPLGLPIPRDPRGRAFADAAVHDAPVGTEALARRVGASTRTLERIFRAQTGTGLGAWRRRAAILGSLDTLLGTGSVTEAALAAGYGTPSAYITAFRRELDATPGQYLRAVPG